MTTLNEYLKDKEYGREGGSDGFLEQQNWYKDIFSKYDFKNVMEIGFNAGHSADLFMSTQSKFKMFSFDIGEHSVVKISKEYIDKKFPNRHNLVLGDSKKTIPEFANHNDIKFDFILIDGDHSYQGAKLDLLNCKEISHEGTILVMDDIRYERRWQVRHTRRPTKAWSKLKHQNFLVEDGHIFGNNHRNRPKRGFAWGKYVFNK